MSRDLSSMTQQMSVIAQILPIAERDASKRNIISILMQVRLQKASVSVLARATRSGVQYCQRRDLEPARRTATEVIR